MPTISLKIFIVKSNNVKTLQFDESMIVYDVCRLIRERVPDAAQGDPNEHGLFNPDEDPTKGRWLEQGRTLEYYHLKDGDVLEYKKKIRPLRIKTLDGSIKTILVDDSATVGEITKTVCDRIGIINPEEFCLYPEQETAEMTLRRQQANIRNQKKMDKMREKLHTDDESNWLNIHKSLREQGIDETGVLILRKGLYVTDDNVDVNDPIQVNLIYVQSRDRIINGSHPCTKEEAVLFAAYQCQVQLGNHNEAKHKPGFLNLAEFLPNEYRKIKGIEKDIFKEHRKLYKVTEINAKYRYIQLCRSLKTYGVTFFLVKEKMKGRNRLVPRLLGITRESVMRVDENTKEVLKTWPLTTVRRWAASPNSFTLDFGDYSENFYSVQTNEGEKISQLIAMYIDIIMQKKKPLHTDVPEDEDEPVIVESDIDPHKARMVTYNPSTVGHGDMHALSQPGQLGHAQMSGTGMELHGSNPQYAAEFGTGGVKHMPTSMAQNPQLLLAQQNVARICQEGIESANAICHDLTNPVEVPILGSDAASVKWKQKTVDVSRQNVNATLAAMLASAASIITQTGVEPEDINYTSVGSAVTTIATNLTELAKAVKMLAALSDSDQDRTNLLGAARGLTEATVKLLNSSKPENIENRQALLTAAGEMGATGGQLLMLAEETEVDIKIQEALVSMAKAVASATAALVSNARNVADKCEDEALQNQVIVAAKQTALATQSLIACTKVLAPTIDSHLCQEQLIESCKMVAGAVEKIVLAAQAACGDDDTLQNLGAAATAVTEALNLLIEQIKQGVQSENTAQYDEACAAILAATDRLFGAMGNAQEMVKQAKILAEATSSLVNAIKREAQDEKDQDAHKRLLDAAKALADATSKMVEAAKVAAKNPNDDKAQENLRMAAEHLRSVVNAAATNPLKKKVIKKLQVAAKQAAAVSTQLIAASQGAAASNRNEASQTQLSNHCKQVAEQISNIVQAVRLSVQSPDSASAQLVLINSSQAMIPPAGKLVAISKAAVPTVGDQASALQLGNFAKATAAALAELRAASLKAQEVCGSLEIDSAVDLIKNLAKELQEAKVEAAQGKLRPLPGQTLESCSTELGASSKTVGSSMAQLLTAANQGNENYTGIAARDTSNALQVLTDAARGVAALTKNPQTQEYIIVTAVKVMDQSVSLILEAKRCVENPGTPNKQLKLAQAAKDVSQALNHMVNCLPGVIEYENAIKSIAQASLALQNQKFPTSSGQSYQQLQANLKTAAGSLNVSSSEVVASARGTPDQQAEVTGHFSENFQELLTSGLTLTGATKNRESREQMLGLLRNSSVASSKLLLAAKALSVDPNGPNVQNQLAAAARNVTDSINSLLNLCSTSGPGQKECDSALRNIEAVAPLLENPNEPQNDQSYFDCLDTITENSKVLAEAVGQITSTAKKEDYETFSANVETSAKVVCLLTESAAQAAYLIGVADPHSEAAIPGLVDQQQFLRAQQAIVTACGNLTHPSVTQEKVLAAATVIAKHTGTLCNACKLASSRTSNPVAKKEFVQFAKEVAAATAEVVKKIKVLASDVNEKNRLECSKATEPLVKAVEGLTTFASSPQFASTPAKISTQARVAQEPIIAGGKNIIRSSSSLLASAKNLIIDPNDVNMWQLLAQHTKTVTDSVRALMLAIKEKCPGQKECDDAIDTLNDSINSLDQAMLEVVSSSLQPSPASSLQGFQEQMLQSVGDIKDNIASLQAVSKREPEKLAHEATKMANFFPILVSASVGAASRTQSQQMQTSLLEQTKTLTEACTQLMYSAKKSGGNFKSTEEHVQVDEAARLMDDAAEELTKLLEKAGAEAGLITGIVDEFTKAQERLQQLPTGEMKTFSDYQAKTFATCKILVKNTQEMVSNANNKPSEIITSSRELSGTYNKLIDSIQGAVATIDSDDMAGRLHQTVHVLGDSCIQLVRDGAIVQGAPNDKIMKRSLIDQARICSEKVAHILAAIQAGAVGTQACNEAVDSINGIISDLETASMFATAGALTSEGPKATFTECCQNIVETAKVLVEDTKRLVSSAGSTQEQLAEAARLAVKTITREAENVKLGAVSLSTDDVEAQLLLLNAVRDVAKSLGDLIDSTRIASGKSVSDPAMEQLKMSAKEMVGKVSSLMKTVKNVEDEAARGVQSLEATIDSIENELKDFNNRDKAVGLEKSQTTPETLVSASKAITLASTKTVAAGNSCKQIDVSAAANLSRKAVKDLLVMCKGTALNFGQGEEQIERVMSAGRECAMAYKTLLEFVHNIVLKPTAENKGKLPVFSREVALTVSDIVKVAEELKEGAGFVDLADPQVRAEHELLAAAAAIEAAAKKLSELQIPRTSANEDLDFEEQILEAAKSIAAATKSLVQSARATQKELVSQGKLGEHSNVSEDSLWSEGLVSCAKLVATATSNLCDAANQVVQKNADENKLIAAAKAVAAHTAQLLHAAQVKADPHSENNRRLQRAGVQVKKATEALVAAAEQSITKTTDAFGISVKGGDSGAPAGAINLFKAELEKQEEIARKRRELEALEKQLVSIRRK